MANLTFRYGCMGSAKTVQALTLRYNYIERGLNPVLLKPKMENRDGERIIRSRIGLEAECKFVEDFLDCFSIDKSLADCDAVIVDEAQFLSEECIDKLAEIVDDYNIPVICFGLKTDFLGRFFSGSKRLLEIADKIEEVPTVCWCGRKAKFNARIIDGKVTKVGEQIMIGGNESYTVLCRKHYNEGRLS